MKKCEKKIDFDDILIVPSETSDIESRFNDVSPYDSRSMLPIFTAPMFDVVDELNYKKFNDNSIYSVIPRGHNLSPILSTPYMYLSYSLQEFIDLFINREQNMTNIYYILIDIANGHQKRLVDTIKRAKKMYGNKLILMVGNIANPKTFKILSNAGADYIRCGIGSGSACTTSANGSVGYPMASLIKEIYNISSTLDNPAKIIADGGMRKYSDIIKALALGADYVMIGGMFNKMVESSGECYKKNIFNKMVKSKNPMNDFKKGIQLYKVFRGMSTKSVQKELGVGKLKTSEGVEKINLVKWSLPSWIDNFNHYLRSNMSYCNAKTLDDYIGKVEYVEISESAYKRFNK